MVSVVNSKVHSVLSIANLPLGDLTSHILVKYNCRIVGLVSFATLLVSLYISRYRTSTVRPLNYLRRWGTYRLIALPLVDITFYA